MTAGDAEAESAADIICSLRGADLAGWTPPWKNSGEGVATKVEEEEEEQLVAWPAVARGKRSRSRSRRRSPSGSGSAAKGRWARGSPASPLDYSGSGASTSGGEDGGGFCSPSPAVANHAVLTHAAASPAKVVVGSAGGRRPSAILPPRPAGQRSRKKMRLPEVQQLVRSLTVENVGLREEMETLRRACKAVSQENGELETRLERSSGKRKGTGSDEEQRGEAAELDQPAAVQGDQIGFVLPDLNIPVQDVAAAADDGSAAPPP